MIETKYGLIEGQKQSSYTVYKGVPFAKAPTGKLRFKRPQPLEPWEGVLKADKFGNKAVQNGSTPGSFYYKEFYSNPDFFVKSSEDCLYLNIWVPDCASTEKCPVALWIHGGAFSNGAASNLPFDGTEMAKRNVILVTANYRLGEFGFLCHPLITEINGEEGCGNYGLWDQVMALDWVRENIEAFGGNRDKITLFGQSAGAMSLQHLSVSSTIQGKCSGMILQSGGGYGNFFCHTPTVEEAYAISEKMLEQMGIPIGAWKENEEGRERTYEALYKSSAEELHAVAGEIIAEALKNRSGLPFIPVLDGEMLEEELDHDIDAGKFQKIPYILGSNSEDMATSTEEGKAPDSSPMHRANLDYARKVNDYEDASAFVYYFSRQLPGDDSGAFHSAELWYMFGSLEYCWRPLTNADKKLSEEMLDLWTNFMHNGKPDSNWKPCTKDNPFVKIFDVEQRR